MKKLMLYATLLILFPLFLIAQAPDTAWTRTYGGDNEDCGCSVIQATDGGYMITGWTDANHHDIYLIKTNASGDTVWTRVYGGDEWDEGHSVVQTSDGGYAITGRYSAEVCLLKTDASGDMMWTKVYGGAVGYSVVQTSDGGYAITGRNDNCLWIIKTNASGDTLWTKYYSGDSIWSWGADIAQTTDGGYIVTGRKGVAVGWWEVWLLKTDASGDTLWTKTYGGHYGDWGDCLVQTPDGGYIIVGAINNQGPESGDVYLVKTDSIGNGLWTKTYESTEWSWGHSVALTSDSGYIITGNHSYSLYVIRTNASGDTLWTRIYGGSGVGSLGNSVIQTTDGGYIITGQSDDADVWLLRFESDASVIEDNKSFTEHIKSLPTFFRNSLQLPKNKSCKVFDITGREVKPHLLAPGIYFIEVDGMVTQKVIKVR